MVLKITWKTKVSFCDAYDDDYNYVFADNRRGSCWTNIVNGECETAIGTSTLKSECCSGLGKAWGSPCEPCPISGQLGVFFNFISIQILCIFVVFSLNNRKSSQGQSHVYTAHKSTSICDLEKNALVVLNNSFGPSFLSSYLNIDYIGCYGYRGTETLSQWILPSQWTQVYR